MTEPYLEWRQGFDPVNKWELVIEHPNGMRWTLLNAQQPMEVRGVPAPKAALTALERFWIVVDEDGEPCYSASWPGACHEHINDAINVHKLDEAAKWVVREAIAADHVKELIRLLRYAATHSSVAPLMNDSWRDDSLAALEKLT